MKKSILTLLICAAVTCSAQAETAPQSELAQDGTSYVAIVVKLKPSKPLLKATNTATAATSSTLTLSDPSLVVSTMFRPNKLRSGQSAEMAGLNARYGFDRYRRIELPEDKSTDKVFINHAIAELEQNPNVELVYPESVPVSLDNIRQDQQPTEPLLKSVLNSNLGASAVPDYRSLQDYVKAPTEKRQGYYMGGINRDSVNQYAGSGGEGVTIISMENTVWNPNHINLPPISLSQGNKTYYVNQDHDTSSVGIMAARAIGAGIRGIAWKSKVGFSDWQANSLYNMIPLLKAGDVVQIGMQTGGGEVTGCTTECYLPQEARQSYYDVIKALTDKGVYVIEAAGNGNINLDNPAFNNQFNVNYRDSGAIIAGAFCAKGGKRASFSTWGSRVTSSSWGCWDVVTTGTGDLYKSTNADYTKSFAGTSSANPIIAGVVASLSAIAKAHGITVTPLQMRQILQETGTPLASGESAKIGTQPDMEQAIARIMALKEGDTVPAPTAVAGADLTVAGTTEGAKSYPLDGSKSLNAKSYSWSITKGAGTFWLQEKLNGSLVNSVNSANAYAVIPANTDGQVTYTLTTTSADGRTAQDSMTINVTKAVAPAAGAPAYNAKIAYPTKCTKVSHNGKIWMNQWYVNAGQEEPGKGGQWGAWRQQGIAGNSCK